MAYRLNGTDDVLDSLTEFIKTERTCCSFFNFTLIVANNAVTWLEIRGAEGPKAFIENEMEM